MKRALYIVLALIMAGAAFSGCTAQDARHPAEAPSAGGESAMPSYPATQTDAAQTGAAQTQTPGANAVDIPAYDPDILPEDGIQEGEGFVEDGELYIRIIGIERALLDDEPGIVLHYEMTNLSDENVDTQTLYVEVLQNGMELKHPYSFEPVYLTVTGLAPQETLAFYDEYLLSNEQDPVEAKIRQFLVMVSNPLWVVKTFPIE